MRSGASKIAIGAITADNRQPKIAAMYAFVNAKSGVN
jgi:hypothetical protein